MDFIAVSIPICKQSLMGGGEGSLRSSNTMSSELKASEKLFSVLSAVKKIYINMHQWFAEVGTPGK